MHRRLTLTSSGDTSYPGLVWHNGLLWMSYYSSHEGKSAIYLAKIQVPLEAENIGSRLEPFVDDYLLDRHQWIRSNLSFRSRSRAKSP